MTEHSGPMIPKRRLSFVRCLKLICAFIAAGVTIYLVIVFCEEKSLLEFQSNVAGPPASRPQQRTQNASLKNPAERLPCKLHRLLGQLHTSRPRQALPAQCKRLEPVPGSCQIADELFHSEPTATCGETSYKFCTLIKHPDGYGVQCHSKQCWSQLSAATVDITSGQMLWTTFQSASLLEKWISQLLIPSKYKKHFGFCFISCGEAIDGTGESFDHFDVYDFMDEQLSESVQLLILPPSLPVQERKHAALRHRGELPNINILFLDSVSHQHFFRSLPRTVQLLEKIHTNSTSTTSVLSFELVQAIRSRTFETLQVLFAGKIDPTVKPFGAMEYPPEPLKVESLLKTFKEKGYQTLFLEDLCYKWEWGLSKDLLVHNRSSSTSEVWHRFQKALSKAHIDSVEVTYAMCKILSSNGVPDHFHGPKAVCLNGWHQHEYMLEYLSLYQKYMLMAEQPYFTFLETNVGHEGTGRRIQTLDFALEQYLQQTAAQKNTLTILFSDHGNSYGKFMEESLEARMELFHPFLFMIVPQRVATFLGKSAMNALFVNQQHLISVLDLHYMLQAISHEFANSVAKQHKDYLVTHLGLLDKVSPHRTCNNIPRIMPNLCICENFDMPVESDEYHALFAHLAIGRLNNEIQRQFHQVSLPAGVRRAFGHCRRLHLVEFTNVRKSFGKNTVSLKMDLKVPLQKADDSEPYFEAERQVFFVSMQAKFASGDEESSIILEKVDRISPYSRFSVCADKSVKLQLCLCNTSRTSDAQLYTQLPTVEELHAPVLAMKTDVIVAENTDNCLWLVQHTNVNGGVFSVVNTCLSKVFYFQFELKASRMYLSDKVPIEGAVFPGQEIFLCMAIKNAPEAKWTWSFSLRHRMEII